MSGNRRKAFLVSAALIGGAMFMTACQNADAATGADAGASQGSSSSSPVATSTGGGGQGSDATSNDTSTSTGTGTGKGSGDGAGSGVDTGGGKREPVEQGCGANDISWSTRSESQAGGYILVVAKAKAGITCYLPAALPTVAFGSDGTQAAPAEQSVGEQIKLSGSTAAYAGVNPKTTDTDGGKELDSIIVGIGDDDFDPVSLPVGTITVDEPVVTNWHTDPADAVPFN
ncbi:DUF4232 domain-containing protein [Streptomyces canus]|uniref:DUF4232 domain-containing protein n=1 Tax=Streptomyces canus TaxID=58343 RepID=UPI000745FB2E|nr:DUF4232 domain-containing protein [Streptomyces canus]KUN12984.1 hypothetical protein AQI96_10935 [Streptomyces canus]